MPDSIAIRGNNQVDEASIRGDAGLVSGATLNYRDVQRAIRSIFATGQFDDVKITCDPETPAGKTILAISVTERPVLAELRIEVEPTPEHAADPHFGHRLEMALVNAFAFGRASRSRARGPCTARSA